MINLYLDNVLVLADANEISATRYIHKTHCYSLSHALEFEGYELREPTPLEAARINAAAKINSKQDALDEAIAMLGAIAGGQSFDNWDYLMMLERMRAFNKPALLVVDGEPAARYPEHSAVSSFKL